MAERYKRYLTGPISSGVATEVYEAPDDGVIGNLGPANSVIIGLLIANTDTVDGVLTVELVDHASAGGGSAKTVSLAHTIPLPANTSVDIVPGKLVVQSGDNSAATPALTGDKINVTCSRGCDVTVSVVERV